MTEELKKTTVDPCSAGNVSHRTVLMESPPDMGATVAKGLRIVPSPKLATVKALQATRMESSERPTEANSAKALRTRMVQVPTAPPLGSRGPAGPPSSGACAALSVPPGPPPPAQRNFATSPKRPGAAKRISGLPGRKAILFASAAIVLGVCLALVLDTDTKSSETQASHKATVGKTIESEKVLSEPVREDPSAERPAAPSATPNHPAKKPTIVPVLARKPGVPSAALVPKGSGVTKFSEEEAAKLFLGGREDEALQLYRRISNSSYNNSGVEAMVEVLAQKVETK